MNRLATVNLRVNANGISRICIPDGFALSRVFFLTVLILSLFLGSNATILAQTGGGSKVIGKPTQEDLIPAVDSITPSDEAFNVMFMAEPGDTLVFTTGPEAGFFARRDTIKAITEADIYDTLDYRMFVPGTPYELIEDRLSCLSTTMPLNFNRTVNSFINFFTVRRRNYTQTMLERKDYYFPIFEEALARHGLPDELKYLSIVESGLNQRALSRSGAVGLWQFMNFTAKDHKLRIDNYVDERMDPVLGTEAACKFLKSLYNQFGDWELALAAYNCGPGTVKRTLARTGGKSFWQIYNSLPKETRSYVPQFTAVVYAMNYAQNHNIFPDLDSTLRRSAADTVMLDRQLNLTALAKHLEIDVKEIVFLNPTLRKPISPDEGPFPLSLPYEAAQTFRMERGWMLDSSSKLPELPTPGIAFAYEGSTSRNKKHKVLKGSKEKYTHNSSNGHRYVHSVRRGETLFGIAQQAGVELSELKGWNRIRKGGLKVGQKLIVYRPARLPLTKTPYTASIAKKASNQKIEKVEAVVETDQTNTQVVEVEKGKVYVVQEGDTLWSISQRHGGVSVAQLMRMNKLRDKKLHVGQKLIIG
jgi:membrane-bound lytic murein transglycosylase D